MPDMTITSENFIWNVLNNIQKNGLKELKL
jgi:hypothetical protein